MNREAIRQTLAEQLKKDKIAIVGGLDDRVNLREGLGLDSIDVVDLVINLQTHFGIELKSEELDKVVNVGNLLDLLQVKLGPGAAAA